MLSGRRPRAAAGTAALTIFFVCELVLWVAVPAHASWAPSAVPDVLVHDVGSHKPHAHTSWQPERLLFGSARRSLRAGGPSGCSSTGFDCSDLDKCVDIECIHIDEDTTVIRIRFNLGSGPDACKSGDSISWICCRNPLGGNSPCTIQSCDGQWRSGDSTCAEVTTVTYEVPVGTPSLTLQVHDGQIRTGNTDCAANGGQGPNPGQCCAGFGNGDCSSICTWTVDLTKPVATFAAPPSKPQAALPATSA
ncbi:hypothetical protein HYH03_018904 [Edaphochlamys debaryana]|uniref:Uncharacterized protein n=1 Tax=Edaphochlamys debaryana TaxID=47281 RepID=A0A835XF34_9CHLO|nr:hypothetical protein HYH03_018904 [Edaphochlamys debaryana]|eukprot:KAG2482145.1 hypothetical protein HYH03_018904 [Edaphochlamys debaryana]